MDLTQLIGKTLPEARSYLPSSYRIVVWDQSEVYSLPYEPNRVVVFLDAKNKIVSAFEE